MPQTPTATSPEVERVRIQMTLGLRDHDLAEYMHNGILEYVLRGRETGGFLTRLVHGDILGAAGVADATNLAALERWENFLLTCCPPACHGNPSMVREWIKMGGVQGLGDKTPAQGVPAIADAVIPLSPTTTRRISPAVLITLSGDSVRAIETAKRALRTELAQPYLRREEIEKAIATLEMASLSASGVQLEALKGIK